MAAQPFTRPADRAIADLAARQHGVASRRQLLAAGVSRHEISFRLRISRLHEIHRGVFLVGHTVPPALAREQAALLACGRGGVLSHRTAATLWSLLPYPAPAPICVTVPPARSALRPSIEVHRAILPSHDLRHRHSLPLTSPPRTLLDLSPSLNEDELERIVAEAEYRRLASESELRAQIESNPGRRGVARLRRVLDLPGGPRRTRSPAERRMLRLLRRACMAGFETNARICGYEVDLLWRDAGLAVEIDGFDAHSGRVAFGRDRLKMATLNANGVRVMPITGRQIERDPDGVLERLRQALATD